MKIAVVGNRVGWTYNKVKEELLRRFDLSKIDAIVSGGAIGVDSFAQQFAQEYGLKIIIFYPDLSQISPKCFYDRNEKIAKECDMMIVFIKDNVPCGSLNAMNEAKKLGKNIILITK